MITNLKLKNWRSHLDTNIDFSEGTNCFIGSMGAGKTSIMDSMCFALFGTFPLLQAKKIKLEDIIMKKPKEMTEAEVELSFYVGNDEWKIKRKIKKGKSTAELLKGDQRIEGPQPSKVNSEIERILKIDYDLFTRAIYSEQNQLDMFLTIPKGQRMKKIDELLSIDKFEKARSTVKGIVNKCRFSVNEKQSILDKMVSDDNLVNIEDIRDEIMKLKQDRKESESKLIEVKNRKGKIGNDMLFMKKQEHQLRSVENEISTSVALMTEIDGDIDRLKEELIDIAEKTLDELNTEFDNLNKQFIDIEEGQKIEKENLSRLDKVLMQKTLKVNMFETEKIPDFEKKKIEKKEIEKKLKLIKLEVLNKKLETDKSKTETYQNNLQKSNAIIEQIQESIVEMEKTEEQCPICDNKLSERKKKTIIKNKEENIEKQRINLKRYNTILDNLKNSIQESESSIREGEVLKQRLSDFENIDKELKFLKDAIVEINKEIEDYEKEKKMLEKVIDVTEEKIKSMKIEHEKVKEMLSKKQEVNYKIERLKILQNRVFDLRREKSNFSSFSPSALQNLETEFQNLIKFETQHQSKLESVHVLLEEKDKRFIDLEKKSKMILDYEIEITKITAIQGQLKILERAFLSTQGQLRKNFITAVNQAMESIWEDLYPYGDFTNVRLNIDSGDYILQLEDSTGWISADGVASGGERSTACLALRIAFALVLAPQLRWLVLDEPTHNLDSRGVEDLANVLRDKVSKIVDQIFLITHDSNLETAVSGYLYRLERDKAKDESTKVIKASGP